MDDRNDRVTTLNSKRTEKEGISLPKIDQKLFGIGY